VPSRPGRRQTHRTTAGGPPTRGGGRTMNPPIVRPSKLFHSKRSALRNAAASSPATLLSVQLVRVRGRPATAYASLGLGALLTETARSREFSCHTTLRTLPIGIRGRGSGFRGFRGGEGAEAEA